MSKPDIKVWAIISQRNRKTILQQKQKKENVPPRFHSIIFLAQEMSEQVDLRKLSPNKPLDKTVTTLELLLCSLAKHLGLKVK